MYKPKKWNPRVRWKWSVLKNLTILSNKLRTEAVFPDEFRDVEKLDDAIKFINAYNLQPIASGKCPFCDTKTLTEVTIKKVEFNGDGNPPDWVNKLEGLHMRKCERCGAYIVEGW